LKTVLRRARRDKSIDTTLTFSNTVLYFAGTGNYGNYGKSRVHVRVTAKELRGTTLSLTMQEAEACRGTEHSRILNDVVTHAPFSLQVRVGE